jgi:hypothetical protein
MGAQMSPEGGNYSWAKSIRMEIISNAEKGGFQELGFIQRFLNNMQFSHGDHEKIRYWHEIASGPRSLIEKSIQIFANYLEEQSKDIGTRRSFIQDYESGYIPEDQQDES